MIRSRLFHSKIFLLLLVWRISSVFIVQTYHVPDEYWQSVEVAHKLTFDYGYLTWEWHTGVRSYLYPFVFSILFSVLKFLHLDKACLLIYMPRIFHAVLCAYAEYKFYLWTGNKFALFNLCINWFWYYCASRTLINSFETCLTIIALSEYPWRDNQRKSSKFIWIVGLLCFARPTASVIWFPLCSHHLLKNKTVFTRYLFIGLLCFAIATSIDILCYNKFILTPLEFFKINVINNISAQYGQWHKYWYFTSGLPVILGLNYALLPFAIIKACKNYPLHHKSVLLSFTAIFSICVYSLIPHKEFRFILPVLPMFIYTIHESLLHSKVANSKKNLLIFLLCISNILPGIFFSVFYQHGALDVVKHLRNDISTINPSKVDILFLTNCHATPYYSHLHQNVSMRFLTCEPNLQWQQIYRDETDQFFSNPMIWLENNYANKSLSDLPSHIVVREHTIQMIEPFLKNYNIIRTCPDTYLLNKLLPVDRSLNDFHIYKRRLLNKTL